MRTSCEVQREPASVEEEIRQLRNVVDGKSCSIAQEMRLQELTSRKQQEITLPPRGTRSAFFAQKHAEDNKAKRRRVRETRLENLEKAHAARRRRE